MPEYVYVCFRHAPTNRYYSGVYVSGSEQSSRHGVMIAICRAMSTIYEKNVNSTDVNLTCMAFLPNREVAQRWCSETILKTDMSVLYLNREILIEVTPEMTRRIDG